MNHEEIDWILIIIWYGWRDTNNEWLKGNIREKVIIRLKFQDASLIITEFKYIRAQEKDSNIN